MTINKTGSSEDFISNQNDKIHEHKRRQMDKNGKEQAL